jgi:hypothetical protein
METENQQIVTIADMYDRVSTGYYRCKVPICEYPRNDPDKSSLWQNVKMSDLTITDFDLYKAQKQAFQNDMARYEDSLSAYRREHDRLAEQFWHDAAIACGVANHPKLGSLRYIAYDFGHANGYGDMWRYFNEISVLLKD